MIDTEAINTEQFFKKSKTDLTIDKKRTDLLCVLDNLLKGKKIYDSKTLFAKVEEK